VFSGEFEHTLDDKCRFIVPIRFRERLEEGCVLTRGLDGCVWIFTPPTYEEFMAQTQSLNLLNRGARQLMRLFTGHDLKIDKQGRLVIPPPLREHADLGPDSDVVVVGVKSTYPHIEVWSRARWQAMNQEFSSDVGVMSEDLAQMGFTLK
jgi:MraZ protein